VAGGWISVEMLLAAATRHGHDIDRGTLAQILNAPPDRLYHGTTARFLPRILAEGLKPGQRTHVHLSADPATAAAVGSRRGQPVILVIDAAAAHENGHQFYRAANGVWLTGQLPPRWIAVLPP
jgi:putative RNA 2'-phosphotransferase